MKEMISVDHEISMSSLDFLNNIINPAWQKPEKSLMNRVSFLQKLRMS